MSILPKLLYLFEKLPVPVLLSQMKLIQRGFLSFIWQNASHHIVGSVVLALWSRGSLGAPDIRKYYYATHLRTVIFWSTRDLPNRWSKTEMGITSPIYPCAMLWSAHTKHHSQLRNLCLAPMLFTLSTWKYCCNRFSLLHVPNFWMYSLIWISLIAYHILICFLGLKCEFLNSVTWLILPLVNFCPLQNFKSNTISRNICFTPTYRLGFFFLL